MLTQAACGAGSGTAVVLETPEREQPRCLLFRYRPDPAA